MNEHDATSETERKQDQVALSRWLGEGGADLPPEPPVRRTFRIRIARVAPVLTALGAAAGAAVWLHRIARGHGRSLGRSR